MKIMQAYKKTLTFFSRTHQEEIVSKVEADFYKVFSIYTQDSLSLIKARAELEKVYKNISYNIVYHYFEDDLLEHLLNLAVFITNYLESLDLQQKTTKVVDLPPIKTKLRNNL